MKHKKSRRQWREVAFLLIFEKQFTDDTIEQIIDAAKNTFSSETDQIYNLIAMPDDFALLLANGVYDNLEAIDKTIKDHLIKWDMKRISKVALSILRLACYEMIYIDDVPVSVSINEAVELAKLYAGDDEPAFINGVLGAVAKDIEKDKPDQTKDNSIEECETV